MSYRRRMSNLRPVKSEKHIVDTNGGITGAAPSTTDVIQSISNADPISFPQQCEVGSRVNAIFLNVQVIQEVAAGGVDNIYLLVYKNPGNDIPAPGVNQVGTTDKKKRVIHQEMVMTGTALTPANAIPKQLFKGVILIPRGLRRNGQNDRLQVVIGHRAGEATQVTNFCLQCIYKEYN